MTEEHREARRQQILEAATEPDIVVTTNTSREPIIKKQYIRSGNHINAIGADATVKQELETDLAASSKVIVDDIEQVSHFRYLHVSL